MTQVPSLWSSWRSSECCTSMTIIPTKIYIKNKDMCLYVCTYTIVYLNNLNVPLASLVSCLNNYSLLGKKLIIFQEKQKENLHYILIISIRSLMTYDNSLIGSIFTLKNTVRYEPSFGMWLWHKENFDLYSNVSWYHQLTFPSCSFHKWLFLFFY